MNILFLCNKSPWPPREGGPMAMNMFIEGLADAGHTVRVLAVNSYKYHVSFEDIPHAYRGKTRIGFIEVDLRLRPIPALLSLIRNESYHVRRFISAAFREKLTEVLTREQFDIIQLETLFMSPYIPVLRQYSGARIILRAHNIEHLIWQRVADETGNPLKRWYLRRLAHALKKYETRIACTIDGIVAITENDAGYFRSNGSNQTASMANASSSEGKKAVPVVAIPFGIDPAGYTFPDIKPEIPSLFSLGSMNWIPNQEGIRWFLEHVWPEIHHDFPDLKYYLAGRAMPGWMRNLRLPNVVVLGEVDSAPEFMAGKSIMIVPLFSGSGIRIKIIEGMAAGKTVISTSLGAEGISCTPMSDILIADNAGEFHRMVSLCITDPSFSAHIGKTATLTIRDRYQPAELIRNLLTFYEKLLNLEGF